MTDMDDLVLGNGCGIHAARTARDVQYVLI